MNAVDKDFSEQEFEKALAKLNSMNPNDVSVIAAKARAYSQLKRWSEAEAEFAKGAVLTKKLALEAAAKTVKVEQPPSQTKQASEEQPIVVDNSALPKPKYDWYQSQTHVFVSISAKNVQKESLSVNFDSGGGNIEVIVANQYRLYLRPFALIDPSQSKYSLTSYKIELSICKLVPGNWTQLEAMPNVASTVEKKELPKPYASNKSSQDWKQLEKEVADDKEEEGGDPLNSLLKKIYKDADEDTRRAMMKSYQTSGGTVLTTNWKEAAEKDFSKEIKPPKGQVYKSWEGDIIAKDEDD